MLVSLDWLSEWIELTVAPEALAEQLTMSGLEVDAIERTGPDLGDVCVGRVVACERHPDADRLSVCRVDVGDGDELQVVCGAPNVAAGQSVAVARAGVRLPDGTKLKKSKIRGQVSQGMICSARELALGDEHDGILVLETNAAPGTSLPEVLPAGDVILEVAITANRGDCASMLGMAREVRAHYGGAIELPPIHPAEKAPAASDSVRVSIEDEDGCHHYAARVVRGVSVGASPDWVHRKLAAAGLRAVNNVVDATNLAMLELGQPLHAFDLMRIAGGEIRVRRALAGETIATLDGETRQLETDDLVIADAERAIAIAGVMGGSDSEVSSGTRDLLIESAHFHPSRVRRTSRRLGLSTDASYRFERGVDRDGVARAADRAAYLIAELASGDVATGVVEARGAESAHVGEVSLELARLNRVLGLELTLDEVREPLERLGIACEESGADTLVCAIPSHRNDLAIPEDLIEEVARIHGYDRIPATVPIGRLEGGRRPGSWDLCVRTRESLEAEGLVEVMTFPFLDAADLDRLSLPPDDARRRTLGVLNPIVEDESRLRSTLVPSLVNLARENFHRQIERVGVFELSRVFERREEGELPVERLFATWLVSETAETGLWRRDSAPPFFQAKGMAERLLARLERPGSFRGGDPAPYHHPGASSEIVVANRVVGTVGEIHPKVARAFDIERTCAVAEIDLDALQAIPVRPASYREVSPHPLMRRDLAVLLDRDQTAGEVVEAIRKQAGAHCTRVEVFDRYEGKEVPEGKVSLAFRLVFQRPDRTLTDAEVTKSADRVVQMLARRFGGELR